MTPEELAAMRARVAAATSGPLFVINRGTAYDYDIDALIASPFHGYTRGMFWRKEDAEFYAAARDDVPALLDEVERLCVENARLRAALEAVEYADMESRCPWCGNWYNKGHAPNCQRQAALGR